MDIGQLLEIDDFTKLSEEKLANISIYNGSASQNIIEGIGAIGTLMFESSCKDSFCLNNSIIGKIGLLIQDTAIIAAVLNENSILSDKELKERVAPLHNKNPDELPNKLNSVIGDINNAELSLQQLKSDLYENGPEKETIYAQLDLVASKLSNSLDQLETMMEK